MAHRWHDAFGSRGWALPASWAFDAIAVLPILFGLPVRRDDPVRAHRSRSRPGAQTPENGRSKAEVPRRQPRPRSRSPIPRSWRARKQYNEHDVPNHYLVRHWTSVRHAAPAPSSECLDASLLRHQWLHKLPRRSMRRPAWPIAGSAATSAACIDHGRRPDQPPLKARSRRSRSISGSRSRRCWRSVGASEFSRSIARFAAVTAWARSRRSLALETIVA